MCEEFVGVFGFDLRLSLISELHTHFFGGDILFLEPTIIFKDPFQTQKTFTSDQGKSTPSGFTQASFKFALKTWRSNLMSSTSGFWVVSVVLQLTIVNHSWSHRLRRELRIRDKLYQTTTVCKAKICPVSSFSQSNSAWSPHLRSVGQCESESNIPHRGMGLRKVRML